VENEGESTVQSIAAGGRDHAAHEPAVGALVVSATGITFTGSRRC
jgi:hypothetical protein